MTIVPLIARRDLCSDSSRESCRRCPAQGKARYLKTTQLTKVLHKLSISTCPDSLPGFRDILSPFGCPYELIRRMVPQANIILLTHGYLETRYLRDILEKILRKAESFGFFASKNRDVIVDEAHNFGSCTEACLSREELIRARDVAPVPLIEALSHILSLPLGRIERPRGTLPQDIHQLTSFLNQKRNRRLLPKEDYEAVQAVKTFVERKGQYWVLNEEALVQLDPWPVSSFGFLRDWFKQVILLSGTFHNLKWYNYFFTRGYSRKFYVHNVPIPQERKDQMFIGALYHSRISSKPEHRTPEFYDWVADIIHEGSLLAKDHTLIFVPSYEVLETMYPLLCTRLTGQLSVYREPNKGRIPFLNDLVDGPPSVILGVYGGKFAEGIEIRHPKTGRSRARLIILVGLPFPPPTPEYELLQQIYSKMSYGKFFSNWALIDRHLYTLVQQCLGRGIRSELDRGAALILDYRVVRRMRLPGLKYFRTRDSLMTALMRALRKAREGD